MSRKVLEPEIGRKFGVREVIGTAPNRKRFRRWMMRCQCGVESPVEVHLLMKGRALVCKSCAVKNQTGCKSRAWKGGRNTPLTHYNKFKRAAERRGIEWCLTISDIDDLYDKQKGLCAMSGVKLMFDHGPRNGCENGNASLDRIVNSIGYKMDNVQLVTKAINMGKQGESYEDFVRMCMSVVEHHLCE